MKTLTLILIFFVSSAQALTLKERLKGPLVAAHRGGMIGMSSNTLEQFERARADGAADILEMDIRVTRDGIPVIFHDEELDGKTSCKGTIQSYVFSDLRKCPLKLSGYLIPSFESVLAWNKGRLILNAEFKTLESIKPSIELVQKYLAHESVYFQANSAREEYLEARSLDSKIALLFKPLSIDDLNWLINLKDPMLVIVELRGPTITSEYINRAHQAGKLVSANSFQMSSIQEALGAACDLVYKKSMDIAVTNRPGGCAKQKKFYPKK